MARALSKEKIKRIYALAGSLDLVERDNKEDPLHILVCGITGKTSVSTLTDAEFQAVERDLLDRMQLKNRNEPPAPRKKPLPKNEPGRMTAAQIGLAWRLVYRLRELDPKPGSAAVGERMKGAILKVLGVSAGLKNPFAWVSFEQGETLIEALKRYVRSAERKQKRAGEG